MKTIITTVGNSIFTNLQKEKIIKKEDIHNLYQKSFEDWSEWSDDIYGRAKNGIFHQIINNVKFKDNNNISAEINSTIEIAKKEKVEVFLICTDTIISVFAALLIKKWFLLNQNKYQDINIQFDIDNDFKYNAHIIQYLSVLKQGRYKKGVDKLFDELCTVVDIEGNKKEENKIFVLNITGGYKALAPLLTIFAQINDFPVYYLFENENNTNELICLERKVLEFDWDIIEDNFGAFEKLNKSHQNLPSKEEILEQMNENITEFQKLKSKGLILEGTEKVQLTPLGKIAFKKYNNLYDKDKLKRQNLMGELVELKGFKYLQKAGFSNVKQSFKPFGNEIEIDLFYEKGDEVHIIEVKPGSNIPIFQKNKKDVSIEKKINSESFHRLVNEKYLNKKIIYKVWAYSQNEIHKSPKEKLNELFYKVLPKFNRQIEFRLVYIRLPNDYKKKFNWEIDDQRITEFQAVSNSPKGMRG